MARQPMTRGVGFDVKRVQVHEIISDHGFALCRDSQGMEVQVSVLSRMGGGAWPKPGDVWTITKQFGGWVFLTKASKPTPPVITAPRDGADPLTIEILDALLELGLVVEEGASFTRSLD
jgi:hypothetical protein